MELAEKILTWVNLVTLLAGFAFLWFKLSSKLGELRTDLIYGLKSIQADRNSYGLLLGVLSTKTQIFSSKEMQEIQEPYRQFAQETPIDRLLGSLSPGNPIAANEVERLRGYVGRIQKGESLEESEAKEFYQISKKLESEEPYRLEIGAVLLVGLAAFFLGLAMGKHLSNGASPN